MLPLPYLTDGLLILEMFSLVNQIRSVSAYQYNTKILRGDSSGQTIGEGSVGHVTKKISEGQSVAGGGGRPEGMGT